MAVKLADPDCLVVTIDGPAGSGKSTTAAAAARRLGFRYMDTGAMYRAVTLALLESGPPEDRWENLTVSRLGSLGLGMIWRRDEMTMTIDGEEVDDAALRTPSVTAAVSRVAAVPSVRKVLQAFQRRSARKPGLVCEGRDMGTVVFPEARVKVFLTADPMERARRRILQRGGRDPDAADVALEAERLEARDALDSSRETAPLKRPTTAVEIDATRLPQAAVVDRIVGLVEAAGA